MKLKNISVLAASLALGFSSLHAVPTDPAGGGSTGSDSSDNSVVLTSADSGTTTSLTTSQVLFSISLNSGLSDAPFTFKDSALVNGLNMPYSFGLNGMTAEGTTEAALALNSSSDPICLVDSAEDFSVLKPDGSFGSTRTSNFTFFITQGGSTTVTFTNGTKTYTYTFNVVDDTSSDTPSN